jgi:hypothetical protein
MVFTHLEHAVSRPNMEAMTRKRERRARVRELRALVDELERMSQLEVRAVPLMWRDVSR